MDTDYDSCPCRGIHFISRYMGTSDYCVDGTRVAVNDETGITTRATPAHRERVRIYLIAKYGEYCIWHAEQKVKWGGSLPALEPFTPLAALGGIQ